MGAPYEWSATGLPCYRSGQAPPFLCTLGQLADLGLRSTGGQAAFVDSQHGDVALYMITETELASPNAWPPAKPGETETGPGATLNSPWPAPQAQP